MSDHDATATTESTASMEPATKISSRLFPLSIVIGLTLLSGVVHGYLDGRWSRPLNVTVRGERLAELPDQVGDWVLADSTSLDPGAARILRCYGSQVREYRNQATNAVVNVALLFGPRGPIAVHTPEICYSSIGTQQVGDTRVQKLSTPSAAHELWSVQFAQNSQPDPSLDVWYAWSDGGPWKASKYPRVWMTESLYKIQVAGPVGSDAYQPCREFLEAFLPSVERVIQ